MIDCFNKTCQIETIIKENCILWSKCNWPCSEEGSCSKDFIPGPIECQVASCIPKIGPNPGPSPGGLDGGTIAGIILSVVVSLVLLGFMAIFLWKKRNNGQGLACFELTNLRSQEEEVHPSSISISSDPLVPEEEDEPVAAAAGPSSASAFRPYRPVQNCSCLISWSTFPAWRHSDKAAVDSLLEELFHEHQDDHHFGPFPGEIIIKSMEFDQVQL